MTDGVRTVALKGVRGMIADAMVKSLATAAQLTHHGSADATALLAEKARLAEEGTKASVEDLLMLAVIRALKKHPDANGRTKDREVHRFQGYIEPKDFLAQFRFVGERAYDNGTLADFLRS